MEANRSSVSDGSLPIGDGRGSGAREDQNVLPAMPCAGQVEDDVADAITGAGGMPCDPAYHSMEANRSSNSDGSLPIGDGRGSGTQEDLNGLLAMPCDGQVENDAAAAITGTVGMTCGNSQVFTATDDSVFDTGANISIAPGAVSDDFTLINTAGGKAKVSSRATTVDISKDSLRVNAHSTDKTHTTECYSIARAGDEKKSTTGSTQWHLLYS
jgi:hypothetical protein